MKLTALRRRDPAFDQTRFLSRAEAVLALVLRARAEGKPEQARAVASDDMALRLSAEVARQRSAGRRQVYEDVRVRSADIATESSDERWDTIAVRSIHLYTNAKITFELQALDDPRGVDEWTWQGGTVTGPEQGLVPTDPSQIYAVAGLNLSTVARLSDAALGAAGIAYGVVLGMRLERSGPDLLWFINVHSLSRSTLNRTYTVAIDGSKARVG